MVDKVSLARTKLFPTTIYSFNSFLTPDQHEQMLDDLSPVLNGSSGLAEENLQARIRGNILMAAANRESALLLNTGNKTETALGYCSMYGDMAGALAVISDLNKSFQFRLRYCLIF